MARKRRGRPINGLLILDKPSGITSNKALQMVKGFYNAAKAGHTGSLDPLASGMLPLCFGEATKFSQFLLNSDKSYTVTAKLGVITDTGDSDGQVIEERNHSVERQQIEAIIPKFTGAIEQVPSMFSALKHNGKPLYKLARQGIEVERESRTVTIKSLELTDFSGDEFSMHVACTKGTYVRSLVEDMGLELGCGAHVTALRRLTVGPFQPDAMIPMDDIVKLRDEREFAAMDELLIDVESALADWPAVTLDSASSYYILQGQAVMLNQYPEADLLRIRSHDGEFLGIGAIDDDGKLAPKRLVSVAK